MGRSVSYPTGATAVAYKNVSGHGLSSYCHDCDVEGTDAWECPECEQQLRVYDDLLDVMDWSEFIGETRCTAKEKWPSLDDCDKWIGREDHAILENRHCYIGVSEYCGLAAVWLLSKSEEYRNTGYSSDESAANLADSWCARIADRFDKVFSEYRSIGTASNGEQFFETA